MKITESNFTFDGKGQTINENIIIKGPVGNVTLKNFTLKGRLRLIGFGKNGEAEEVRLSSLALDHTKRARDAAPHHVMLERIKFTPENQTPLYLSPGCTYVTVKDCLFAGTSSSIALYLDAESGYNHIVNNTFRTLCGDGREVIAVDGSAYNIIEQNRFEQCKYGGIYLYRNCGQGGTVRHQKPVFNLIKNNEFDLHGMSLVRPKIVWPKVEVPYGIVLGSRQGDRVFCSADDGYDFGSSKNDGDFARNNTVSGNKFRGDWFKRHIKDNDKGNVIK